VRRFTKDELRAAALTMPAAPVGATLGEPHQIVAGNVTKEGIEVKVGQVWKDLDKRMLNGQRHVKVMRVHEGKAVVQLCHESGGVYSVRETTISIRRMHKTSTGWALVREAV
jgi:hypothetical protein